MSRAHGAADIDAPLAVVREALLAAPRLPEWNPAFVRVAGAARATLGSVYEVEVIRGLRGTLTYTEVEEHRIAFSWRVPMLSEQGIWELRPRGRAGTAVAHTVERQGALAAVLAHTLRTLPRLRLERLAEHTRGARLR
ncbi:SRPBCC family protein [Microbacterium sp. NPDC089189]|uniref:SRPBCC family protein n=1 Tax=Microbacterium sp. NPDC089189 TaxID=3154972 RepID=UPI003441C0AA